MKNIGRETSSTSVTIQAIWRRHCFWPMLNPFMFESRWFVHFGQPSQTQRSLTNLIFDRVSDQSCSKIMHHRSLRLYFVSIIVAGLTSPMLYFSFAPTSPSMRNQGNEEYAKRFSMRKRPETDVCCCDYCSTDDKMS
jgi:hypothetical protein